MADNNQPDGDQRESLPWLQPTEGHIRFHWIDLAEGDTLFKQGDRTTSVYLIIDGRLRVTRPDNPSDEPITLAAGQLVGEKEVTSGGTRPATAIAASKARLLRISSLEYRRLKQGEGWLG